MRLIFTNVCMSSDRNVVAKEERERDRQLVELCWAIAFIAA